MFVVHGSAPKKLRLRSPYHTVKRDCVLLGGRFFEKYRRDASLFDGRFIVKCGSDCVSLLAVFGALVEMVHWGRDWNV